MIVTEEKCYVCGKKVDFSIANDAVLLREACCSMCGASIRNSDTARVIVKTILGKKWSLAESLTYLNNIEILEAAAGGSLNRLLSSLKGYTCFEYFDDVTPGEIKDGVLCNNFEKLTFDDNRFDLIISQDVLEHVLEPGKAFSEINRVLKPGGYHVFTVPIHEGRLSMSRENLPPIYHGDPLRGEGCIVYTDWGDDICSIIDKHNMLSQMIKCHTFHKSYEITNVENSYNQYLREEPINYFRYNSIVIVSKKL